MNKASLLALVIAFGNSQAFAKVVKKVEGQSSIKVEEVTQKKNKVEGDIDEEITNAKLRAESGSKSKFSLSSSIGYTGGSISRPFGAERPNIRANSAAETKTAARVGLSARYRWTKNDSITLGTEFGLKTPFQGDIDPAKNQINVTDPSLSYSHAAKFGVVQNISSVGIGIGTSNESQKQNQTGSLGISSTALRSFENGLTVGAVMGLDYYAYSTSPKATGDDRYQYDLGVYPFAEYSLSDKYSLRTLVGFLFVNPYGAEDATKLEAATVYQSLGVGIALNRDVYLYPNLQFIPENLKPEMTNVGVSATVNLF